jgi:hypothetical protein
MFQDILEHPKTRFQPSAEAGFSFSGTFWHPLTSQFWVGTFADTRGLIHMRYQQNAETRYSPD